MIRVRDQIAKDLPRTFLSDAQRAQLSAPLRRVLTAYSVLNPSVQYVQGMNFIAAFILRQFFAHAPTLRDPELMEQQCFWTLAALMSSMETLFAGELVGFHTAVACFERLLAYHAPRELVRHLRELGVLGTVFSAWLHTLFTHPNLSQGSSGMAKRIWDILILERMDLAIVLKLAYLVLIRHKQRLLRMDFVGVTEFLKSARCFEFEGADDHGLLLRASKLQLNEVYLAPVRHLKYVQAEADGDGDEDGKEQDKQPVSSKRQGGSLWAYLRALLFSDDD